MQYSLFGKRPLFDQVTLQRRRTEWLQEPLSALDEKSAAIITFSEAIQKAAKAKSKETALEQSFNQAFFVSLLGYRLYPGENARWTAWPKPPTSATGLAGEPDLLLGVPAPDGFETVAVVELKRPGTSLDSPQPSHNNRSAVEQAFEYATKLATCRWVIVSDMRFLRLYSVETQEAFHEIDLWGKADLSPISESFRLLSLESLVAHGADSQTSRLLKQVREEQALFRDAFYKLYSEIRADLLTAIEDWGSGQIERKDAVLAVQRLLDRLLFIFFCEDHLDRLLPNQMLEKVVDGALRQPGSSNSKAYDSIKQLFRDLDLGVQTKHWSVPKYNGELFKIHPIVDSLSISDDLHSKQYTWIAPGGAGRRVVNGVFGLHVFDFWRELDRDLLGNLFERSIGDLTILTQGGRPDARSAFGVFYTASRLAKFVAKSAVTAMLSENVALTEAMVKVSTVSGGKRDEAINEVSSILSAYRIADLSCGSGVFLTAALDALLNPYRKAIETVRASLITLEMHGYRQSELLKKTIFGIDVLPQAVELAKLSLWLTAARRNEPSAELSNNFIIGDALDPAVNKELQNNAGGGFDLIVGNPPWGAEYNEQLAHAVSTSMHITDTDLDSWEIFLGLVFNSLKPGGRFAILIPETFFSPEKARTRRWLLEHSTIEKVYALGADWFTADVRMGTVVIQGVKTVPLPNHSFYSLVIAGHERQEAQSGHRPIEQLEFSGRHQSKQARCLANNDAQIQVLASEHELDLLMRIEANSVPIGEITSHSRGDEINASGLIWTCGSCNGHTVPGEKKKGGKYESKPCPNCNAVLSPANVTVNSIISDTASGNFNVPYIDGTELARRYQRPHFRFMRTDLLISPPLKSSEVFMGPKILIRQAGVGITATIVDDSSRCPQSIYIYRATPEAAKNGYTNEFILACLVSRTMNYICMKKFAEIDPAKAFAKLTHARIASFPIPRLSSDHDRAVADEIRVLVREMINGAQYGGTADYRIELNLRQLWKISGDEGRFINGFFSTLPTGQAVLDLFPNGAPSRTQFPTNQNLDLNLK